MSTIPSFQKATRKKTKLKLAVTGPSGSGKTFSALRLAKGLGGRIAFIDTENGSASLYSGSFDFDVLDIAPPYTHGKFIDAIKIASDAGYSTVVIDSASHFWEGVLEFKAKLDTRPGSNSYTNWNDAGAKFKTILDAVLQSPVHVICCLRSKMDYVMETNERGKQAPKKVGLAPIMRDGIEYEFTTVFDVNMAHTAQTSKDRTGLFKDEVFQITEETGKALNDWMDSGSVVANAVAVSMNELPQPAKTPAKAIAEPAKIEIQEECKEWGKRLKAYAGAAFANDVWKHSGETWELRLGTLMDIVKATNALQTDGDPEQNRADISECIKRHTMDPTGLQAIRQELKRMANGEVIK